MIGFFFTECWQRLGIYYNRLGFMVDIGDRPFTVFAPVNADFAKIDANTLNALLQPSNKDQLTAILTYYVVAQYYFNRCSKCVKKREMEKLL